MTLSSGSVCCSHFPTQGAPFQREKILCTGNPLTENAFGSSSIKRTNGAKNCYVEHSGFAHMIHSTIVIILNVSIFTIINIENSCTIWQHLKHEKTSSSTFYSVDGYITSSTNYYKSSQSVDLQTWRGLIKIIDNILDSIWQKRNSFALTNRHL